MNAILKPNDMPLTMSSKEIADLTGKEHKNVIRDIRAMLDELANDGSDLSHVIEEKDARGYTAMFHLNRELTDTLLTGYSASLRRKVVARWHQLESQAQAPAPSALSRMQILEIAMESEKARIEAEAQRDEAIRTKALIGSKREATAMSTAAKAVREVKRLTEELGRNARHATVIAVEKATGRKFGPQDWRPLREFCKKKGLPTEKVTDPRWGEVKAWPSEAWSAVYGIDLRAIFPEQQAGMH